MSPLSNKLILSYFAFFASIATVLALPVEVRDVAERARTPITAQPKYYTSLVAFGASYTDNAHSRPSQYASSLRNYAPFSNYGGRYTNGPVAVEYMVSSGESPALTRSTSPVQLIDYAYGGSHIDNSLTGGSSPASKDQIAQYLSDVASGSAAIGSGRVLHYINSGINPLTTIWLDAYNAGLTSSAISNAKARVTANANAMFAQLRSINTNANLKSKPIDFMVAGIPPLEIVPTFGYQCNNNAAALSLVRDLAAQFNSALSSFVTQFRTEMAAGTQNKVFFYDMAATFYDLNSNPSEYGLTASPITKTCYNSSTGGVCSNPNQYLYFDTLHPTTAVMNIMASKMNAIVNAGY